MTVDYFPHLVKCGRTICILEAKYGNDGYAFWYKLLETLGESDGHYYDCRKPTNWEYLLAKTRVSAETAESVIATLVDLGKVDAELWRGFRVLWVGNLVGNLEEVYRTRNTPLPQKPSFLGENPSDGIVFSEKTPRTGIFPEKTVEKNGKTAEKNNFSATEKESPRPENPRKSGVFSEKTPEKESFLRENPPKTEFSPRKRAKGEYSRVEYNPKGCVYTRAREIFNSICFSFHHVDEVSDAQAAKIRLRFLEMDEDWETFGKVCRKMEASDFLKGGGADGWKASFDWLIRNGENWKKVIKGNYDNGGKENGANSNYIPYKNDDYWK